MKTFQGGTDINLIKDVDKFKFDDKLSSSFVHRDSRFLKYNYDNIDKTYFVFNMKVNNIELYPKEEVDIFGFQTIINLSYQESEEKIMSRIKNYIYNQKNIIYNDSSRYIFKREIDTDIVDHFDKEFYGINSNTASAISDNYINLNHIMPKYLKYIDVKVTRFIEIERITTEEYFEIYDYEYKNKETTKNSVKKDYDYVLIILDTPGILHYTVSQEYFQESFNALFKILNMIDSNLYLPLEIKDIIYSHLSHDRKLPISFYKDPIYYPKSNNQTTKNI